MNSNKKRHVFTIEFIHRFLRNPTELKSIKNISLLRQQTQQQQSPQSGTGNQNTLKQEQQVDNQHHQHVLNPHSLPNSTLQQLQQSRNPNTQNQLHLHQLPPLSLHQQQQMLHQNPPPSPRVLALNGAFHQLTTASSPTMIQHHQNGQPVTHFKMEPNMDAEDLPTDLSTSGNSERNKFNTNQSECYP